MKKRMMIIFIFIFCLNIGFAEEELRTWTDSSGKRKIKAKFGKYEESVYLEMPDGKMRRLPLNKLSKADIEFVRGLIGTASNSDDPFAGATEDTVDISTPVKP